MDSDIERDREFLRQVRAQPRGFTWGGTFSEVCALVMGYDCGSERGILDGFQNWLGEQRGRPELAYWRHATDAVVADRTIRVATEMSSAEDALATDQLLSWLESYLG